nr:cytochrome P450 [Novosphingobium sp. Rr 2-17]
MTTSAGMMERPEHVPADRVFDFDIYRDVPEGMDFHQSWRETMANAPYPLMWTPHNGGHWVALRADVSDTVMSDFERFSNHTVLVPKDTAGEAYRLIPLSLDPPEHRPFRNLLNENLGPKPLKPMEQVVVDLAVSLIDGFKENGRCNFTHEFAEQFPVRIFMRIVDLPVEDLPTLKHLADQYTRPDGSVPLDEVTQRFRDYLRPIIATRRASPGEDMISRMINGQIGGRPLSDFEAENICIQVLVGGLDTVVNMLGFIFSYLARDHDLRRAIAADLSRIDDALLEFFRRFPVVSSSREIMRGGIRGRAAQAGGYGYGADGGRRHGRCHERRSPGISAGTQGPCPLHLWQGLAYVPRCASGADGNEDRLAGMVCAYS